MMPAIAQPDILAPVCPMVLDLVDSVQQCDLNSDLGFQLESLPSRRALG